MKIVSEKQKAFFDKINPAQVFAWGGSFLFCLVIVLISASSRDIERGIAEFQAGRVAERDVIASRSISYKDEQATRLLMEAQERLVPAVFRFSHRAADEQRNRWNRFVKLAEQSGEDFLLYVHSEFPGIFSGYVLDFLYQSEDRSVILEEASVILDLMYERGIFSLPDTGLDRFNPYIVELIRQSGTMIEQERVPFSRIITLKDITYNVMAFAAESNFSMLLHRYSYQLLEPFFRENVFFSHDDTAHRIAEARAKTEPVMRHIEQGQQIIKRGFIITEEEMMELRALNMALPGSDFQLIFANLLFLLLLFCLLYYFCGSRIIGRNLLNREIYLVAGLSALYIAGSVLVKNMEIQPMPVSVVVPTALVIILPSILIHARLALLLAMALPLGAFITGSFDGSSFVFALVSGMVAAYSLQGAEKRMDLVRAGLVIAAANVAAMTAVLLWQHSPAGIFAPALFWAAFNGIASGMLVLGLLPPLEHALNAATSFRLIELSDLNAPILRQLFTAAPGTYSHSIMVANLAETACQDIGASPLLARVGSYYHDLGKMEKPECFVENQSDYNCHDDMAPGLSAAVIRSHVKLGVEKARQLRLPQEVIDIISEHHGDSVITWFYNKALKQEGEDAEKIDVKDFSYPGSTPCSRESAVVMLADVTEAAVRTLEKPTAEKMEKYIRELIARKVEDGQLAGSELTFKDIELIKNAFVRVLAGYYHSRIEYPRIDNEPDTN